MAQSKQCDVCGGELSVKNTLGVCAHRSIECRREYERRYRKTPKGRAISKKQSRRWYWKNPKARQEYAQSRRERLKVENPEKLRDEWNRGKRRYRKKHGKKIRMKEVLARRIAGCQPRYKMVGKRHPRYSGGYDPVCAECGKALSHRCPAHDKPKYAHLCKEHQPLWRKYREQQRSLQS